MSNSNAKLHSLMPSDLYTAAYLKESISCAPLDCGCSFPNLKHYICTWVSKNCTPTMPVKDCMPEDISFCKQETNIAQQYEKQCKCYSLLRFLLHLIIELSTNHLIDDEEALHQQATRQH